MRCCQVESLDVFNCKQKQTYLSQIWLTTTSLFFLILDSKILIRLSVLRLQSQQSNPMNILKTSSKLSSPINEFKQQPLYKSKSKFIRTQQPQKAEKRKVQNKLKEEQRICFISPNKIKVSTIIGHQFSPIPSTQSFPKLQFLKDESIIQTTTNHYFNQSSKINDSLLSIYDQLNSQNQRKREADMFLLRQQLQNMKVIVEQERIQKNSALQKLKDFQYLQRFLMERETKICEITEKNIILSQKVIKIQQQKEALQKQLVYLRNTYEVNLKRYNQEVSEYKSKCIRISQENKSLAQVNGQLKIQIQELIMQNNQSTTAIESFITQNTQKIERSPTADARNINLDSLNQNTFENDGNLFLNKVELVQNKSLQLQNYTYRQLLSSRSNRLRLQKSFEYDRNDDKSVCERGCSCSSLINKLNQKLRYNQIEIDILKRMKGRGELVENDNEKLKKQIKNLTQRIEYLSDKKKQKKKKPSDSPLQFSLSPKKSNTKK